MKLLSKKNTNILAISSLAALLFSPSFASSDAQEGWLDGAKRYSSTGLKITSAVSRKTIIHKGSQVINQHIETPVNQVADIYAKVSHKVVCGSVVALSAAYYSGYECYLVPCAALAVAEVSYELTMPLFQSVCGWMTKGVADKGVNLVVTRSVDKVVAENEYAPLAEAVVDVAFDPKVHEAVAGLANFSADVYGWWNGQAITK